MVGALISIAAPTMAQEAEYTQQLNAVSQALKDKAPGAEKMAKSFISDYKKNAPAILALGSSFLTVRNFAKADEMAELVLSRNKKNEKVQAEAYILKGDIEAVKDQAGNGGKAAEHYATAMSLDPKNPVSYMRYASVYRNINPAITEQTYARLRQELPDFPIEAEAAHTFFSGNKFDKAFENFAKCDRNNLDETQLVEYVISAVQLNKYKEALSIAEFGMDKFPKNAVFGQL